MPEIRVKVECRPHVTVNVKSVEKKTCSAGTSPGWYYDPNCWCEPCREYRRAHDFMPQCSCVDCTMVRAKQYCNGGRVGEPCRCDRCKPVVSPSRRKTTEKPTTSKMTDQELMTVIGIVVGVIALIAFVCYVWPWVLAILLAALFVCIWASDQARG